ncbi:hypothetical protein ACOMHN_044926 [Nucella lapillus]
MSVAVFPKNYTEQFTDYRTFGETRAEQFNLPAGFNPKQCYAPEHKLSTCQSLIGSNAHRYAMTVYAGLTLLGNMAMFVFRVFVKKSGQQASYGRRGHDSVRVRPCVLTPVRVRPCVLTHLSVSDLVS